MQIGRKCISNIRYADDMVLICGSFGFGGLKKMLLRVVSVSNDYGQKPNELLCLYIKRSAQNPLKMIVYE